MTENVLQNTPNCTIDKKSGEYAPIPLNIMCAVIHYLLFLYKQDAREAMRVVFSVLTKGICMHKTNFLRIYSNIVFSKLY